jgi:hypothetical protein
MKDRRVPIKDIGGDVGIDYDQAHLDEEFPVCLVAIFVDGGDKNSPRLAPGRRCARFPRTKMAAGRLTLMLQLAVHFAAPGSQ